MLFREMRVELPLSSDMSAILAADKRKTVA